MAALLQPLRLNPGCYRVSALVELGIAHVAAHEHRNTPMSVPLARTPDQIRQGFVTVGTDLGRDALGIQLQPGFFHCSSLYRLRRGFETCADGIDDTTRSRYSLSSSTTGIRFHEISRTHCRLASRDGPNPPRHSRSPRTCLRRSPYIRSGCRIARIVWNSHASRNGHNRSCRYYSWQR